MNLMISGVIVLAATIALLVALLPRGDARIGSSAPSLSPTLRSS